MDVSALKVGDSIHVRDLPLPKGVEADVDAELTVFIVAEPAVASEAASTEAAAAPEVIKEKKAEAASEKK